MRRPFTLALSLIFAGIAVPHARAQVDVQVAALFLHFEDDDPHVRLHHGVTRVEGRFGKALEFTSQRQYADIDFSRRLDGASAVTVGGWFFPFKNGEQFFVTRGEPQFNERGECRFPPADDWVNFVLGSDARGFLLGTINGNGQMPFPQLSISELAFDAWNQLVVVKAVDGVHKFYRNGVLVHSDEHSSNRGRPRPFRDTAAGEPLRLAMPGGGRIGEAWIVARELTADEVARDFERKRETYHPALPAKRVTLREMNAHHRAGLWPEAVTAENWPATREAITASAMQILGEFPKDKPPLDPQIHSEDDCGTYVRRKVSIQVHPGDRMPAYLLIPKERRGRLPAIVCFYGTTSGAGKDTIVGLSGRAPGSPPQRNHAFAIDMVEAGFVAFAADYLRDGERIKPGRRPYDTTDFYAEFPDWSIHGKDLWDTSRAIDYLQTLDFVDGERVGMTGHSYGGHSTIFTAALEPRIKAAVANGPVSDFLHYGLHWGVPKGASNSQSLPALRSHVLDHTQPLPITFYEFTALIAPRPLLVGQAAGERRPNEEENYAAVREVYAALGAVDRVRYHWYAGDHDYPPEARQAAVEWFNRWLK